MVEPSAQKSFILVAADAYYCQYNEGKDKMENNPAYFEKGPTEGLNWLRNLPWSSTL